MLILKSLLINAGHYPMPTTTPTNTIIRLKEVVKRIGLSRSTLYVFMQADKFPRPLQLGARAIGWLEKDIDDWLAHRTRDRDRKTAVE